ncbi:MAG: transcription elongation factor GreA [Anaerolineae bacterium]|mgnify:CR=1 FL=1|jgi:transcription elongation factor GreA|uniref:transcription elongation factor GreA n=1 Tax=Candidatus Amarolinea dominans TaxID=3140696 RepID=UPI001E032A11|nr:transcription elongation factor GreA [Anaerolineae bacterium]MBK7200061.1 transcription elongation factor GreA [Anaerolineae bacterium]MBK9096399.1 transcription elongation factor GreA [Anaerolineae bacterium]MBK9231206.1 transcription elongation factor GreA [Anaerolineae bacterium]
MANNKEVYLTVEGIQKLREELEYLQTVRRADVAHKIHEAKMDGDVSENAGYDEAKNEQAFVEGRIKTVERLIAGAVMIESNHHKTHVVLGARVTVRDIEFDETDTYVIVGSAEANPAEGRISNESPMGRALMGGRVGQHKQINTPGGTINVDIVEIE